MALSLRVLTLLIGRATATACTRCDEAAKILKNDCESSKYPDCSWSTESYKDCGGWGCVTGNSPTPAPGPPGPAHDGSYTCVGPDGNDVDWWFTYIHPDGLAHAYYDSSDRTGAFHVFENEPTTGAFGKTIAALYAGKAAGNVAWVTYNDELRGGGAREQQLQRARLANASASETSAHAKGALLTNGTAGFWLVHSVPKLLDVDASEFSWGAAKTYGQSMLCLSLGAADVEIAATQLTQMALHATLNSVSSVPSALQSRFPRFVALLNGEEPTQAAGAAQITTLGGTSFTSFAKRGSWGKDLYEDLVQPQLGINMAWETWRRSPYLESFCKVGGYAFDSVNVEYISLFPGEPPFHYTKDHAKWGITLPADEGEPTEGGDDDASPAGTWLCVGGINRMASQYKRGGGTLCGRTEGADELGAVLTAIVTQRDNCSG